MEYVLPDKYIYIYISYIKLTYFYVLVDKCDYMSEFLGFLPR